MSQRFIGDGRGREGGRQKGTPNKSTAAIKEALTKMLCSPKAIKQMQADMAALQPYQRLQMQERLLAYIMPKQASVEADVQADMQMEPARRLSPAEVAECFKRFEAEY